MTDAVSTARLSATLLAVTALALTACAEGGASGTPAPPSADESGAAQEVDALDPCARPNLTTVEPGALTFATSDTPAPPYFLTDEPADRLGLESELAYALAERMGFQPQEVTWETVSPDLVVTGQFLDYDVAVAGFTPRPEEFPAVEYTRPYIEVPFSIIATEQDVPAVLTRTRPVGETGDRPRTPDELAWAASFQGPGPPWLIGEEWLQADTRYEWVRGGPSVENILNTADAVVVDEPTLTWLEQQGEPEFSVLTGVPVPEASFAMAMVAGNPLKACVDRALGEMSEDSTLSEIIDRWTDPRSWIED